MPETYVVTPDYNGKIFLKKYFDSLFKQTYNDFKIIFVDNSENDESINYIYDNYGDKIESDKIIIIKNPANYGFAKATNQGINEAFLDRECKYVVCLNNDTEVNPDFLTELIKMAVKYPQAGSIQSKMIWGKNPELIDSVGLEYSKNGLGFNRGAYKSINDYDTEEKILGCCAGACLYLRESLEDIKIDKEYFDEDFFAYYEDFDVALRLQWAGWKSYYAPNAIVCHYKGGTEGVLSDFTIYHNWRNYTWTIFKNMPFKYILKNFYLIIPTEIFQIILNLSRGRFVIFKAKIDAYSNLRNILNKKNHLKRKVSFKELNHWFKLKWF